LNDFHVKVIWDAMLKTAERVETVYDYYNELRRYTKDTMVVNQIVKRMADEQARTGLTPSQRVNVSTNFGVGTKDTGQNKDHKTYFFDEGSTALYWKILGPDNKQDLEIMNFASVVALIYHMTGLMRGKKYLLATGDHATGDYLFDEGAQVFSNPKRQGSPKDNEDLVNLGYLRQMLEIYGCKCAPPPPPPPINEIMVIVEPDWVAMKLGEDTQQKFTARVTGTSNQAVTWSASAGEISEDGLYTPPSAVGSYKVKATSQADTSKSGVATVEIYDGEQPVKPRIEIAPKELPLTLQNGG